MARLPLLLWVLLVVGAGCASDQGAEQPSSPGPTPGRAASSTPEAPTGGAPTSPAPSATRAGATSGDRCEAARSSSGNVAVTPDGARLWYDLAGPAGAPVVAFLHGGPGYNAYAFRRAVGAALERHFRVLYLDQRGCGRSWEVSDDAAYGMDATVDDIAWLQGELGIGRLHVIGHSFGGAVAVALALRHPDTTGRLILVETAYDLAAALEHQLASVEQRASGAFVAHEGEIYAVLEEEGSPFTQLGRLYGVIGRLPLQRELHFATTEAQERMEAWDAESGLLSCTRPAVVSHFIEEGWFAPPVENPPRLGNRGLLMAGARSEVIGAENIAASAQAWQVEVVTFADSGHFPFVEEPERFVAEVVRYLLSAGR